MKITYTLLITAALITPAHAEKETVTIHVTAHVVGMVCTENSPYPECQDAAAVARLAEDDTVIVTPEK